MQKPLLQTLSESAKLREAFESKKIDQQQKAHEENSFRRHAKMGLVYLGLIAVGGITLAAGSYLLHDEAKEIEIDMVELQEDINMMDLEADYANGEIVEQEAIIEKARSVIGDKKLIVQNKRDTIVRKQETIFHKRCILAQIKQDRGLPITAETTQLCLKELGGNVPSSQLNTNEARTPLN